MYSSIPNNLQPKYQQNVQNMGAYSALPGQPYQQGLAGAVLARTYSIMQQKTRLNQSRDRFIGLVFACLIFTFVLMTGASILAMYSKTFRHFVRNKIAVIVLLVFMAILSIVFMQC